MRYLAAIFALVFVFALTGCGKVESTVDTKQELPVPTTTVVCYFIEIENTKNGEEVSEDNKCVTKDVFDKQITGEPFVS